MEIKNRSNNRLKLLLKGFICLCAFSAPLRAEVLPIDETCSISILNRSVQAAPDGTWRIDNVPSFMGQVRARATCIRGGQTLSGQTNFFTVAQDQVTSIGAFNSIDEEATPVSLDFATGNNTVLYGEQTYFRLRVFANYADGSREDISRFASGINYTISNPAIAQIDGNGVMQGLSSGRVLVTARKDGTSASLSVTIVTTGDSDDDGLPDDFETANGLDPNDPVDAAEDGDSDGLSALEEYLAGTDVNNADTDGDSISDGEEAIAGNDGFITNPLLADSDSDGINDNLELTVGTDPTDINSVNYGASIAAIELNPQSAVLTFNSIQGADASVQLTVTGNTLDGEDIDLTGLSKGTNYNSSDLQVCNFGGAAGEVFAGLNGDCVVTADNSGFTDTSDIVVQSFAPIPLNFLLRGDQPTALDVDKNHAYIGTNDGLQIVDVSDPLALTETGFVSLGTNVTDVKVQGNYAYLATATVALVVIDISDPIAPVAVTSLGAAIPSKDIAVSRNELYIAAQTNGMLVVNIADPESPRQINSFAANSSINAVAVSATGNRLVVADNNRLRVITRQGSGLFSEGGGVTLSSPQNIKIENDIAYIADVSSTFTLVDISNAESPQVTAVVPFANSGRPRDVALAGKFAFLADTSFTNGVPIIDVLNPAAPAPRGVVDFTDIGMTGATGYSIDVDNQFIYVVTTQGLQIAQYQQFVDDNGIAPQVTIVEPAFGDTALEGGTINVVAEASDDVAVATVSFFADGELLYTDIAEPFEFVLPLPIAQSNTEISVLAVDYGGDASPLDTITINLIADSDYDGLSDDDEINIHGTSPFEADTDNDGLSDPTEISLGYDPLDEDMDNDGLLDGEEIKLGEDGYITNPYDPDSDNDTMPDGFESRFGLNPLSAADANLDLDGDGLSNVEEYRLGFDPTTADSDMDGMPDEYEREYGLDPLNPNDFFGDLDDDGVPNGVEYNEGTDPTNPDVTAPEVASLIPEGGVGLPANSALLVRFNEAIRQDSLSNVVARMTEVADPDRVVEGIVTLSTDGFVLVFNPVLNLQVNTEYNFSVSGAKDVAGNPMAVPHNALVLTSDLSDTNGPAQVGVNPFDNAQDVAVNTVLTLDYDEVVDPSILNDSNFYLYDNLLRIKVPGGIGITSDGKQLFFTPDAGLLVGRSYYLYVSNIRDLSGNACTNCGSNQRIDFETAFSADNTAPEVLASTVSEGATDVPLNARFVVNFDEPVSTVLMESIQLTNNGLETTVSFTLRSDKRQLTITTPSLLLASAEYSLSIDGIKDLSGNSAGLIEWNFTTGTQADSSSGVVTSWSIPNGATDVPLNALIEVTLSERIDPTSITTTGSRSFYFHDNTENRGVAGSGQLSADGRVLRFVPDVLLEPDHRYYLYVTHNTYLKDLAGNNISGGSRYFTTGGSEDDVAPSVSLSSIADGSVDIPVNGRLIVELDERIGDGCQPQAVLSSAGGEMDLSISISSNRQTLILSSASALSTSTSYSLSLSNLCDYAGNAFSASDVLSFTTSASDVADTTGPSLVSITPTNNATGVALTTTIVMEFSEPVDQTVRPLVSGGGVTVLGDYSVSGSTVTFTPAAPLQGGFQYTVTLYYNVFDFVGNYTYLGYRYFTTVSESDNTAPTLSAISPVADAVGINPGATIRLTFSEPMAANTVNSNTIALYANGSVIRPSVYRSADGQQVTLTANMPTASIVSVVLTDDLQDLSGNSLVPVASSFTTGVVDTDTGRPRVSQQIPTNGSNNLFDVDQVVLVMSEPMDTASVESYLHVASDGVLVDGTIEVLSDQQTIRFTADAPFTEGAYVQIFLESLATDDSGNAAYDYDGYFRMGSTNELIGTRATPVAYSPYNNQTGVALNPFIMVRYNEPLDPAALNSALIDLQVDASNVSVPVVSTLDSTGTVLQISPQVLLEPNTVYELRLDNIVDSDGDTNTSLYTPEFTTASDAVDDDRQPVVLQMSPPDGSVDVGLNGNYAVRFDERMNPISFVQDNQLINVQFSEDNRVVRYDRQGTLAPSTEVTEPVPALVDLSGNPVVAISSTFTTAVSPDFSAPTAVGSVTGTVATNPVIAWVFNEPIDPVSVSSSGVYLRDLLNNVVVPSTIGLSADGRRLDIVPTEALAVGRSYRYYAYYLRDLSGNTMNNRYHDFTTDFADDTTAPVVLDSTVSDGQVEVPTNTRFGVRFDESLSQLITLGISLTDSVGVEQSITISFNSDRTMVTVTPNQLLDGNRDYTLTVAGMEDVAGNAQVVDLVQHFTTAVTADLLTGSISAWSIPNGATDVPLNALIEVTLSERIDPTSITTTGSRSFYFHDNTENRGVAGSGQLSADGRVLRFVPDVLLEPDHRYYLYVTHNTYLKDLAGNNISGGSRYFTTGGSEDDVAPSVSLSSIADGSVDIPVNGRLIVELDERIGDGCQPQAVLSSAGGEMDLSISISSNRQTLILSSASALSTSTSYSLSLSNLCDYAGNAFSASDVLSFTTSASDVADTTGPSLVSITPTNNATGVALTTTIVMEFSEPVDQTVRPLVSGGGVTVLGDYSVSGSTVTFTPAAPLQGGFQYTVTLYYNVFDFVGNYTYLGYRYFTTVSESDNTAPTLSAISPVADAVGINPGATIRLTFSEPMAANTVNSNTIALYANGSVIRPSVYRSADGQQVTLTANMPTASIVSVVLTDDLQDLSGNSLVPVASSFTTGVVDTDTGRPRVSQQIPTNGSNNLFDVDQVVLVMSEPMDTASVESYLHVASDGVLVDGTIEVLSDQQTIRFTADAPFTEGAYVQIFLESLATDDSGNAAYDYDGYFRMGSTNELIGTRATPVAYSPYNNQTGVALNPFIMVRYNEPLDPAALNSALIDLQVDASNVSVPVVSTLDSTGTVLQISPQVLLEPNTVYELRLDNIVDSDGDTNTSLYTPEFTTASDAVDDDRQPVVLQMSPPDGSVDVGLNGNYAVRFDERMNPISFVQDNQLINVQFSEDNRVVRYDRQGTLAPSTEVTEPVPALVDLSGNPVVAISSTFTTAVSPDFSAPTAVGSVTGTVATNPVIAWVFNEPIDPVSVSSSGVYLRDLLNNVVVPSTIGLSADGRRLDIVPTEALAVGRSYRYYAYYLRDLSGNTMNNRYHDFTTDFADDTTAPVVLDSTVSDGQVEVPTNTRFGVRFDESLSQLITLGISLTDSVGVEQSITISFNSDRTMVTVTPNQLLDGNRDYTLTVAGMEDVAGNAQVVDLVQHFTTAVTADLLTGSISAWSIPNGATDVPLNALIEVTLSERIDPTSITTTGSRSFYFHDNTENRGVAGSGQLSADGRVLRFVPDVLLEPDHRYYLYVTHNTYLKDLAGNNISGGSRYFTTGGSEDDVAPSVSLSSIADGSVDIPVNGRLIVELDERIGDGCQPQAVLSSAGGEMDLSISISSNRQTLILSSASALSTSTSYSLSLSNLCDYAGNAFSASDVLSFTTSASDVADTTGPSLVSITPTNNATGVALTTTIVMEFSEPVDQTVRPLVSGGGVTVLGDYSVSGSTVTFTPAAPLQGGFQYTVTLYYNVFDFVGNYTYLGYRYFTTVSESDNTAPTLSAISPVADAVGINPGATIRLTFSEPMAANTVNSNTIALYANGSVIRPSVYRSADGQQVTLTANMPTASIVSVVLTDDLQDLSGNSLVPVASSFTTGVVDTDTGRPRVSQQIPTNGSNNLFDVDQVVLVMSEPMDTASVESYLHVASDGVLVDGTIEVLSDQQTIRFTADAPFTEGAYVQIFLESLATDDSGNAAYDYDGYFRMGSTNELIGTRATPVAYSPYNNQTGVALNPFIMVRYNEPLDPAALNSALIDLQVDASNVSVPVVSTLDSTGTVLQISPQVLLEPNTVYELRLDNIVDSDGDTNTSLYTPEFTTASDAVDDDRQPVVLQMSPPDGSVDVGLNGNYAVRFDERMNPISFVQGNQLINVQFSEDNQVVRYDRQVTLAPSTEVTEPVPALVDLSGNPVVAISSTFTTAVSPDFSAPTAVGSVTGTVATNPVIAWVFNEPIDPVSVSSSGVYLRDLLNNVVVPSTIGLSADGRRLDIVPTEALAVGRSYRYYAYYLRDLSGNTMNNRYHDFTTDFADDTTAPVVLDSTVSDGQVEVPTNTRFSVRFDESLSQLITLGISLTDSVGVEQSITISFNSDRTMVTVTPNQLLDGNRDYTLTVAGMEDVAGNAQVVDLVQHFTTAVTADLLTGSISAWSIPNGATDVPLNALIEVTLSERIDPTSITTTGSRSFYFHDNTENRGVAGSGQLSADGRVLRFVPDVLLEPDHRYYLYVTHNTYLKDLAGNNISGGSRYFTTGGSEDDVAPSVSLSSIADGSVDIPVNGRLIVELDERIGDGCQPQAVLSSAGGEMDLSISISSNRQTLILSSASALSTSTSYSLSLSNLCDYAGNAFSASDVLSFTTSASDVADTTGPSLVSITPTNNATGVALTTTIVMEFSEPVDQTVRPLVSGGGVTVLGDYSVSGSTVTFTPAAPLQGGFQYTVTLYYNVFDFVGNYTYLGYRYFTTVSL